MNAFENAQHHSTPCIFRIARHCHALPRCGIQGKTPRDLRSKQLRNHLFGYDGTFATTDTGASRQVLRKMQTLSLDHWLDSISKCNT
ncbi:hypothetical protein, partial [Xanthomonas oryzae]|uniref:hypothetical protein n=1 Tax=Xanthomonas oryzae TaxID=347 RepID=UPI0019D40820